MGRGQRQVKQRRSLKNTDTELDFGGTALKLGEWRGKMRGWGLAMGCASAGRSMEGEKGGRVRPRPKEITEGGEARRQRGPGRAGRLHTRHAHTQHAHTPRRGVSQNDCSLPARTQTLQLAGLQGATVSPDFPDAKCQIHVALYLFLSPPPFFKWAPCGA